MMYQYRQNNSGGYWALPAIHVFVEADSPEEADGIAEQHGVYFDGIANGIDCECCGQRWQKAARGWCGEGEMDEPRRIGNSMWLDNEFPDEDKVANVLIIPKKLVV